MQPKRSLHKVAGAVLLLTGMLVPAYPATIIYGFDFVGTGVGALGTEEVMAFQLTAPDFTNPPLATDPAQNTSVFFSCTDLDVAVNCGVGVYFSNQSVLGSFSAQLYFSTQSNSGYAFFFPTDAFISGGIYTSGGPNRNTGSLRVTPVAAVPEPLTILLMLVGIISLRCRLLSTCEATGSVDPPQSGVALVSRRNSSLS